LSSGIFTSQHGPIWVRTRTRWAGNCERW